ncbi:MAG: hypothetical protein MUE42_14605, partial [Opitutaceae bacterium]|nr:hypothetical protein [Opitutaceae bacterium]
MQLDVTAHALPLYAAAARQKISATLYGNFLKAAFENQPQALLAVYDQAPWLYQSGNIETGHMSYGAWTLAARIDWLNALIACPADNRPAELTDALLTTALRAQNPGAKSVDASLAGLPETAPIFEIALQQARAPLAPVAVLSLPDLLHHGWETQALHLVTRHLFLNSRYGDRELGARYKSILDAAGAELTSLTISDENGSKKPVPSPAHDLLARLEAAGPLRDALVRLESDAARRREAFYVIHRSFWLSPGNTLNAITHGPVASTHPRSGKTYNTARDYLEVLSQTGNVELCRRALQIANSARVLANEKISDEDIAQLSRHLAPEDDLWITLNQRTLDAMPEHERARTLETYYWDNPNEGLGKQVYQAYIASHDLVSAQRFYDQARLQFGGSVAFSNQLGPARLMRAILDGDKPGIKTALIDSDTGSAASLTCEMMAAVEERNPEGLKHAVETSLKRYPPRSDIPENEIRNDRTLLRDFIPLWPALADPAHRDHAKALDYFGARDDWPGLRWLVAERLNLSTEDRIRFFGGEKAVAEFRFFIAHLRRDTAAFEKLYADLGPPSKRQLQIMSHVLIHQLRADLL